MRTLTAFVLAGIACTLFQGCAKEEQSATNDVAEVEAYLQWRSGAIEAMAASTVKGQLAIVLMESIHASTEADKSLQDPSKLLETTFAIPDMTLDREALEPILSTQPATIESIVSALQAIVMQERIRISNGATYALSLLNMLSGARTTFDGIGDLGEQLSSRVGRLQLIDGVSGCSSLDDLTPESVWTDCLIAIHAQSPTDFVDHARLGISLGRAEFAKTFKSRARPKIVTSQASDKYNESVGTGKVDFVSEAVEAHLASFQKALLASRQLPPNPLNSKERAPWQELREQLRASVDMALGPDVPKRGFGAALAASPAYAHYSKALQALALEDLMGLAVRSVIELESRHQEVRQTVRTAYDVKSAEFTDEALEARRERMSSLTGASLMTFRSTEHQAELIKSELEQIEGLSTALANMRTLIVERAIAIWDGEFDDFTGVSEREIPLSQSRDLIGEWLTTVSAETPSPAN